MARWFFSCIFALLSTAASADRCCGWESPELTLSSRVFLRPRPPVVQDHIWNFTPICRSWAHLRFEQIDEDETYFLNADPTTGVLQTELVATGAYAFGRGRAAYGRLAIGSQRQQNRVIGDDNYNVELYQAGLGGELPLGGCWILAGDLLAKWAEQRAASAFPFRAARRLEPALTLRNITPKMFFIGAAYLDSFVARDTVAGDSLLIERANLFSTFEYRWCPPHRAGGIELHYLRYDSRPSNEEERLSVWFRTGFPQMERHLFFRYEFDYRRFDKVVLTYLSMNHRVTHAGTFTWQYPVWNCGWIQLEYTYGWRRSRELSDPGQWTTPEGAIVPIVLFKQTLNLNRAQARYRYCFGRRAAFDIRYTYYFDSMHYRGWRLIARLEGKF